LARNKFDIDEELESPFDIRHLKRAGKYIGKHKGAMILAFLCSSTASVLALFGPKILQWTLDDAVPNKNFRLLFLYAGAYLVMVLIGVVFATIRSRVMARVGQEIVYELRRDVFAHLQKLPFSYYDSRPHGKILVRVINYVGSVSDMLSNGIINIFLQITTLIFIAVFMFMTNVRLALIVVAGLPVFVGMILFLKPKQRRCWQDVSNKTANYNAYLAESIDGVRVSQLFDRQEENIKVMTRLATACRRVWMRTMWIVNTVWVSSELITQIVFSFLYVAGAYWLSGGIVQFGVIMAMGLYVSQFWQPITALANIYNTFINNIAYLERIFELLDEPVTVDDAPDAYELPPIKGAVEFRDVTFGYEPDTPVLEHFELSVHPGENIALVGPTGAGKTTVVNLLCRFYDVQSGAIVLDGEHDIAKVTLASLRAQMGIMLQDSVIFSGTIRDNIRYGRLDATDEEIEAAARAVYAHEFIRDMEHGYDTELGERGGRLSAGQRQLISFARTLLADPKILILDEATSSIDTKTERLLQQGIAALLKGRTSFIIAHRLSTIRHCDRILYIGNKRIEEAGSHEELIDRHGLYYQLYTAQREATEG